MCGLIGFAIAPRASELYWERLSHDTKRVGAPYISNQSPYGTAIRIAEGQGHYGAWWIVVRVAAAAGYLLFALAPFWFTPHSVGPREYGFH